MPNTACPRFMARGARNAWCNMPGRRGLWRLVLAMGLWGYKLAVRDIAGVPVIRALEGPMRVAPDDPGGSIADHQGLSVNDVAAVGSVAAPSERVVLAPKPVELSLEDAPGLLPRPWQRPIWCRPGWIRSADLVPVTSGGNGSGPWPRPCPKRLAQRWIWPKRRRTGRYWTRQACPRPMVR